MRLEEAIRILELEKNRNHGFYDKDIRKAYEIAIESMRMRSERFRERMEKI